jgi:hypothetical protein
MKRWKKIVLIVFAVILILQIPFIFRRFQFSDRAAFIESQNAQRTARHDPEFAEYKGIIHTHTSLGGHSTGSFDELIEAASLNKLDFVVMTEHTSADYDTSALTLNGVYKNTLFIGGNEADTISGDRFLMLDGGPEMFADARLETPQFLEKYHAQGKAALITYPEKFKSWDSNFDGIEVFSLHTNAKQNTRIVTILDMLWSFPSYPGLTLAENFRRPDANLQRFDEIAAKRRISLFAGTDAHSNIGFHLLGDDAGNRLVNLKLDRYQSVFGIVRAHILVERGVELTKETVIDAFRNGRMFVGFDVAGDTSGFSFTAESGAKRVQIGGEVALAADLQFVIELPLPTRFVIFRNGEKWIESGEGDRSEARRAFGKIMEPGAYRVEVYRDDVGSAFETMPWIMSNPIYVR